MNHEFILRSLESKPRTWLITGVAGFIGSNLLEALLKLNQRVIGLDNLSTGFKKNLEEVQNTVSEAQWKKFTFHRGDIRNLEECRLACTGVDVILHQAALGSVPRSVLDPVSTNESNVTGFLNVLVAAREARITRMVYASSSSVYGDEPTLPKVEHRTGKLLSPYAVSKFVNELYASVFGHLHGMELVGLRYFNVFGKRQDPNGDYAAVIPRWYSCFLKGDRPAINGDGETSRDFSYIENVIQANLLGALVEDRAALNRVYNIACGEKTTLNELFRMIRAEVAQVKAEVSSIEPMYRDFRTGDIRHSLANISEACERLKYRPTHSIQVGLQQTSKWYVENL